MELRKIFFVSIQMITTLLSSVAFGQNSLILSEYVEGSESNKAIELYNPTSSVINLSGYAVSFFFNGAATPGATILLNGSLQPGGTCVLCHSNASGNVTGNANQTTGLVNFNGNDAVALLFNGSIVDCFGRIGEDPGTSWGNGATVNHTLRRMSEVISGDPDGYDSFDPAVQWDIYPEDSFDDLGRHSVDQPPHSSSVPFTIFHVNDMHGRLSPHFFDVPDSNDVTVFERVGGAACLTTKFIEFKSIVPEALVLDGGDISEGNPLGDLRGNGAMVDFLLLLDARLKSLGGRGIDAAVVGNHDVRDIEYLSNMEASGLPFISVNICHKNSMAPYFTPWVTVTIDSMKIGIFGYTNDESSYLGPTTEPEIDIVKGVWSDNDPSTIDLREVVAALRDEEECDRVIMLTHMGHSRICSGPDALLRDDGTVAPPEVAITGHWHTMTTTAWEPKTLNGKTVFDEAGSYLQYIARLDIDSTGCYSSAVKFPIRCDSIVPDPQVLSFMDNLENEYLSTSPVHDLHDTIGYSAVDLKLDKDKWWTLNEYPWNGDNTAGAWICDAMAWQADRMNYSCDLALQSGGGIRKDIPAGPVTYLDIYETYPRQNDNMVIVSMTGKQIRGYLEEENCGASISDSWRVVAADGTITGLYYLDNPVDTGTVFTVAVSEYMFNHYNDIRPWPGTLIEKTSQSIREAIVAYTGQFTAAAPMQVTQGRYTLDTEMAGRFDAVVTMIDDSASEPFHENAFVRLLSASPQTVVRRGRYVPESLVNNDGSINRTHQMCESMWYRGHLGFPAGTIHPGDLVRISVEGGYYRCNPQFMEAEGIVAHDSAVAIIGHDSSLAAPVAMPDIASFWDEFHENHYVRFFGSKISASRIRDSKGMEITVYETDGFYTAMLPGAIGDLLEITGVQTAYHENRRFRTGSVRTAAEAGVTGWPSVSHVNTVTANPDQGSFMLTADAADIVQNGSATSLLPVHDAQVAEGNPSTNYGSSTSMHIQKSGGNHDEEIACLRFDLSSLPTGLVITRVKLRMYCWKVAGEAIRATCSGISDDGWSESSVTWSTRPGRGAPIDTTNLSSADTWYEWEVTPFVLSQYGADSAVSFTVAALDEGGTFTFDSKEYQSGGYGPCLEIFTVSPGQKGRVTSVAFYYRFSTGNRESTSWKPAGTADGEPWRTRFNCINGNGHYEFYSRATDDDGNMEPPPVFADASFEFTGTLTPPRMDLLANGSTADLEIEYGNPVTLTALVLANGWTNQTTEEWMYADAPDGNRWYYDGTGWRTGSMKPFRQGLLPGYSAPVTFINAVRTLPVGRYTFTLIADSEPDGVLNGIQCVSQRITTVSPAPPPAIMLKVNGSSGADIEVSPVDTFTVTISLEPNSWSGVPGEWWVYADRIFPAGSGNMQRYWYNGVDQWQTDQAHPMRRKPLTYLSETVFRSTLPEGEYIFRFIVDCIPDNQPDETHAAASGRVMVTTAK